MSDSVNVAPIPKEGETEADYATRKADLLARLDAAKAASAPSQDATKQPSTEFTSAFDSEAADRALNAFAEFGMSPGVIADLKAQGLGEVSKAEQAGARRFLAQLKSDPEMLRKWSDGSLEINAKVSAANVILASKLGNFTPEQEAARMRAIAALRSGG